MIYLGGKSKIAKYILPIILKDRKPGQWYVEPFYRGSNVIKHVEGPRIAADIHPELIALLKALQKGWKPPFIHEDEYRLMQLTKKGTSELRGYVGFLLSFGGAYFSAFKKRARRDVKRGSAANKGNYQIIENTNREGFNSATNTGSKLKNCKIIESHYDQLSIPSKSIIYCDPPYKGTTGYKNTITFHHENFYHWCKQKKKEGHQIFISEFEMPEPFKCIWGKKLLQVI